MEPDDAGSLIPPGLNPDPVNVRFEPIADADFGGLALRRGQYVNDRGDRFILLGAARVEDADRLDEYLRDLKVWAIAAVGDAPEAEEIRRQVTQVLSDEGGIDQTEGLDDSSQNSWEADPIEALTARLLRPLEGDEDATAFALSIGEQEPRAGDDDAEERDQSQDDDPRQASVVAWLIDPTVRQGEIYWYYGGDSVRVSVKTDTYPHGAVGLRRPGRSPLGVNPPRTVGASGGCSVRGRARMSQYTIQGAGSPYKITYD